MRKLKIAFLLNPLSDMHFEDDTSFCLMRECDRRGHKLYFLESQDLVIHHSILQARLTKCLTDFTHGIIPSATLTQKISWLDAVIIRKEPPFDLDYLSMTYLLDNTDDTTFLMNSPGGIRRNNEKLSAFLCPRHLPFSIAGYNPELLMAALNKHDGKRWVLKPIFEKAGKGIREIRLPDRRLPQKIRKLSRGGSEPVILQRFVEHKKCGDKRILLLDGEPLGAFRRIPGPRDFRANMALGATAEGAEITRSDHRIIRALKRFLKSNGLTFTGIDVLGDKITEINVTSPAGIPEINRFTGLKLERTVVDYIERKCA